MVLGLCCLGRTAKALWQQVLSDSPVVPPLVLLPEPESRPVGYNYATDASFQRENQEGGLHSSGLNAATGKAHE